jgi:hypothetical protein
MSPFSVMGEIKEKMKEWISSYSTTDDLRVLSVSMRESLAPRG